jgi:hypothetical protein
MRFGFGHVQGSLASLGAAHPRGGGGESVAQTMQGSPEQRLKAEARLRQKDSQRRLSYPNLYTAASGGLQPLSLLYVAEQAHLPLLRVLLHILLRHR